MTHVLNDLPTMHAQADKTSHADFKFNNRLSSLRKKDQRMKNNQRVSEPV